MARAEKDKMLRPLKPLYKVVFYIIFTIAEGIVRVLYPVRALGKQNLPPKGKTEGYVYAPNHLAAIDPLFLLMARGWRSKMLIMGKGELFGKLKILDLFWALAGAFPIERGAGQRGVLEDAMAEVRAGRDLLIYPEGTRSKTGELGRVKSGAFVVAMEAGADIIPVLTWYRAARPKPFRRCTIVFGKPLTLNELGLADINSMEARHSARAIRGAKQKYIQALEGLREEYKDKL